MGENTKIEWTVTVNSDGTVSPGHTFNPVIGCMKVSAGCTHCYAEALMDKRYGRAQWGPNTRRVRTGSSNWKKPLQWNANAKATGKRAKVFCASLSDVFEDHPDWVEPRRDLLQLIERTPHLDWLLLTKRPENIERLIVKATGRYDWAWLANYPNVWIGTSVEDQAAADKRIPELLKVPTKVRFLSCEPLLGPVILPSWDSYWDVDGFANNGPMHTTLGCPNEPDNLIDWVICGGESGQKARPMQLEWARDLRDQCQRAGTAFFMKQLGGVVDKRHDLEDMPEDLRIREFPQ